MQKNLCWVLEICLITDNNYNYFEKSNNFRSPPRARDVISFSTSNSEVIVFYAMRSILHPKIKHTKYYQSSQQHITRRYFVNNTL